MSIPTNKNIRAVCYNGTDIPLDPSVVTETKTVSLDMSSGDQVVSATGGKYMMRVTVSKPATLIPGNIKRGVSIGGVTGTYSGGASSSGLKLATVNCTVASAAQLSVPFPAASDDILVNTLEVYAQASPDYDGITFNTGGKMLTTHIWIDAENNNVAAAFAGAETESQLRFNNWSGSVESAYSDRLLMITSYWPEVYLSLLTDSFLFSDRVRYIGVWTYTDD